MKRESVNPRFDRDVAVPCPACKAEVRSACVGLDGKAVHFGRRLMAMATEQAAERGVSVQQIVAEMGAAIGDSAGKA